jgi:hypothetical protein
MMIAIRRVDSGTLASEIDNNSSTASASSGADLRPR